MKKTGASALAGGLLLIFLCIPYAVYSAEKASAPEWTVAACPFAVERNANGEADSISELLPRLILDRASDAGSRTVLPEELYRRRKKELLKEKRKLYDLLEKAVYERDRLIVSALTGQQLRETIAVKEKEAEKLRLQLEKNQKETSLLNVSDFKERQENIVLWKKSASELYTRPSEKVKTAQASSASEPEDINGLITGFVTRSGSFIKADVSLILYPGGVEFLKISEVDNIDKLDALAASLASRLEFALQNTKKVRLFFETDPAEVSAKISVRLDGQLLPLNKENGTCFTDIRGGIHDLYIEAEGYQGAAFVYDFSSADTYYVRVSPKKQNHIPLKIKLIPPVSYSLFFNGLAVFPDSDTEDKDSALFTVNGFPVLAELQCENGFRSSFLLTEGNVPGVPEYRLPAKQNAAVSGIEKKRKIMYNSYAALIVSLPVTFILLGKHTDEYNSWARGNNIGNDLKKWETAYYTAAGVSIGLGVNFLVQLGLYLHTANSVLPVKKSPEKNIK